MKHIALKLALRATFLTSLIASVAMADTDFGKKNYQQQYDRAIRGVMSNILGNGAVIASPSTQDPNYYYDWVRDTALTMKGLIALHSDPKMTSLQKGAIEKRLDRWVDWELARQQVYKMTDQGEPRFYVDGRANHEPWGRPQNDGPALRALAAMELAEIWTKQGRLQDVKNKLYRAELPANTLIKRDLEYVAHKWTEYSIDLWEEERAMHYYTMVAQMAALAKGAKLAQSLGDLEAAKFYRTQANNIQTYLGAFIDRSRGIIKYAISKVGPLPHKQSDLDVAVLLIANQTFDGKFLVPVPELVRTVNALTEEFRKIYKINQMTKSPSGQPLGVALGRYPDDKYSGFDFSIGNPWHLATLALAELTCKLKKVGYARAQREQLDQTILGQFNRVLTHMGPGGSMAEQFRRDTGYQQGARDLTWSYTAYITAYRACFSN